MVQDIEELAVEPQRKAFRQGQPLGHVKVHPEELRTTKHIAPQIADLACLRRVAARAGARARVHGRDEGTGIQPLNRSRLCDTRDRIMAIECYSRTDARELGTASLHNAVAVCRIWRALTRERYAAVIEGRAGHLPTISHLPEDAASYVDRQFVHVAGGEVAADIVVAVSILSAQHPGQRRNDPAR